MGYTKECLKYYKMGLQGAKKIQEEARRYQQEADEFELYLAQLVAQADAYADGFSAGRAAGPDELAAGVPGDSPAGGRCSGCPAQESFLGSPLHHEGQDEFIPPRTRPAPYSAGPGAYHSAASGR